MSKNTVRITYTGDASQLRRENRQTESSLEHLHKTAKTHFLGLTKEALGAGAAMIGAGGLVFGLEKATEAAKNAEVVDKRLEAQLKAVGIAYDAHAQKIHTTIDAQSKLSAFTRVDLEGSFTSFVRVTKNVDDALKLNALAADVARGRHMSLEAATLLVTKASIGQVGALRRMGIDIPKVTTAQDRLTESKKKATLEEKRAAKEADNNATKQRAIAALQKSFAGQAKAYGDSSAGAQDKFRAATERLKEDLGKHLLPALSAIASKGSDLVDFVDKLANAPSIKIAVHLALAKADELKNAIAKRLEAVDWSSVGKRIAVGIGAGLTFTSDATNSLLGNLLHAVSSHVDQIAKIGVLIAAHMLMAVSDPVFWAHHLDLLFAILLLLFGRGLGKIGVRIGELLGVAFGKAFASIGVSAGNLLLRGLEAVAPKLAATAEIAVKAIALRFGRLGNDIKGVVSIVLEEFGKVPGILGKAFRFAIIGGFFRLLLAAIDGVLGAIQGLLNGLGKIPKLGAPFKAAAHDIGDARDRVRELRDQLEGTHSKKITVDVALKFGYPGGHLAPGQGDGTVGQSFMQAVGLGATAAAKHSVSTGGGPVAPRSDVSPGLWDELAIAHTDGLGITSTYRPGAITATGNPSLHGMYPSHAFDASGPEPAMRTFFMQMVGRPGLSEVIHSPYWWHPGEGIARISNSAIMAQHYSHVHVGSRQGDGKVGRYGDGLSTSTRRHSAKKPKKPAHHAPHLPRDIDLALARARQTPSPDDDVKALERELGWIDGQLKRRDLTPSERTSLLKRQITVRGQIRRKKAAMAKAAAKKKGQAADYTVIPAKLRLRLARARLTPQKSDDLAALIDEDNWLRAQLKRKLSAGQRADVLEAIAGVESEIGSLAGGDAGGDPTALPDDIEEAIADAALTDGDGDDIAAYRRAETYYKDLLASGTLTQEQRIAVKGALKGVEDQITSLTGSSSGTTPDQDAQLAQAQQIAAVAQRRAELDEAFIETGVFGTTTTNGPGAAAGGGAVTPVTVVFQTAFAPSEQQARDAAAGVARGLGSQGFQPATSVRPGI
jgi:hypothetical protein